MLPRDDAFAKVRALLKTPESHAVGSVFDIAREIVNPGPERHLNVVLISVESSSGRVSRSVRAARADYAAPRCARHLFFTSLYASGTRTVRGLSARALGAADAGPVDHQAAGTTRGSSLGSVFDSKGYDSMFVYGGYGYFDNMNYFRAQRLPHRRSHEHSIQREGAPRQHLGRRRRGSLHADDGRSGQVVRRGQTVLRARDDDVEPSAVSLIPRAASTFHRARRHAQRCGQIQPTGRSAISSTARPRSRGLPIPCS